MVRTVSTIVEVSTVSKLHCKALLSNLLLGVNSLWKARTICSVGFGIAARFGLMDLVPLGMVIIGT